MDASLTLQTADQFGRVGTGAAWAKAHVVGISRIARDVSTEEPTKREVWPSRLAEFGHAAARKFGDALRSTDAAVVLAHFFFPFGFFGSSKCGNTSLTSLSTASNVAPCEYRSAVCVDAHPNQLRVAIRSCVLL